MEWINKLNNVYLIDGRMWGFEHYMSIYLVKGDKLALIDTGEPNQLERVRAQIKAHGFSVKDIEYIFLTHCEHPDHNGNAGALLKEATRAKVYINPIGEKYLTDPATLNYKSRLSAKLLANRFPGGGVNMEPVSPSRIHYLHDGDVYDLGNGERLRIIFAPGHQPSGLVIYEEKNKGLFINDLVGNYFPEIKSHYALNPLGSDHIQAIASLKKMLSLDIKYLYLGHYGIYQDDPKAFINKSINKLQQLLDIGRKYVKEGKPELIAETAYKLYIPDLEKLKETRLDVYEYATTEHVPFQLQLFTKYCQEKFKDI
jgi:glyoxylase-like metal-dependent hydrolase (beta-lactamase superfamily II)